MKLKMHLPPAELVVFVAGSLLSAAGASWIYPPAGLIVLGVLALAVSIR